MVFLLRVFALIAVILNSFIPVGFMPDANAHDGQSSFVICSETGAKTVYMDANDSSIFPDKNQTHAKKICPFKDVCPGTGSDLTAMNIPAPVFTHTSNNTVPATGFIFSCHESHPMSCGPPHAFFG